MAGQKKEYAVSYTARDLILYALSIGMGSSEEDAERDLRFLYEQHEDFSCIPTFCFAMSFWADSRPAYMNTAKVPRFPPPIMSEQDMIPRRLFKGNVDLSPYPFVHAWQSIVWNRQLPMPSSLQDGAIRTQLSSETVTVQPKNIGTFVTQQGKLTCVDVNGNKNTLCTTQSITLVLGAPKDAISSLDTGVTQLTSKPKIPEDEPPLLEWVYASPPSQALLYRMASGDTNHIHVDTSASEMLGTEKKAPILHGLFTLALAFRGVLKCAPHADKKIRKLEARFSQPAFVGDVLCVKVWKDKAIPGRFLFQVLNNETEAVVVDSGCADIDPEDEKPSKL